MSPYADRQLGPETYGTPLSRLLAASYAGPNFPTKLRLLGMFERLIGRRRIIRRMRSGFLMALDPSEFIQSRLLFNGLWEEELTLLLSQELRPDDVFYDIGANVGYYSCLAAQHGIRAVIAFEPDPLVCRILAANLRLNRFEERVTLRRQALSDAAGTTPFQLGKDSAFSGFGEWQMRSVAGVVEVEATTLDAFALSGEAPTPSVVKIDVEGWEERVLRGARSLLAAHPPRLIAFEGPAAPTGELDAAPLRRLLSDWGYDIRHLRRTDGTIGAVENYAAYRRAE